jgi:hypothetical protein
MSLEPVEIETEVGTAVAYPSVPGYWLLCCPWSEPRLVRATRSEAVWRLQLAVSDHQGKP